MIAAFALVALLCSLGRYGYFGHELYFMAAGERLVSATPIMGPLLPVIAHTMDLIAPESLFVLRLQAALVTVCAILVAGLIAREFGGGRLCDFAAVVGARCPAVDQHVRHRFMDSRHVVGGSLGAYTGRSAPDVRRGGQRAGFPGEMADPVLLDLRGREHPGLRPAGDAAQAGAVAWGCGLHDERVAELVLADDARLAAVADGLGDSS
ncbi:hypothetical protein M1248_15260 [Mycobacterium sp. 29Ha]|nr:hypothetical protein [Mycobacterium sp. 29Ha]MDV3133374.1 hypothetical protein [Mycobacterium sp. 29Ha]